MMTKQILSCDWGTTSFRLRLVNIKDGEILAELKDERGIAAVHNDWLQSNQSENDRVSFYKRILQSYIRKLPGADLERVPLIISGMASSSIGIKELSYRETPLDLTGDSFNIIKIVSDEEFRHDILLVSGLKTNNDAMRGEETMLLGCDFGDSIETLAIFPGTHSKHATVKNNTVIDIKTYMTGEIFDLLANKSILSKSVIKSEDEKYNSIFETGVKEGAVGNLLNISFHVRTSQLFKTLSPEENYHYLSGLVIGTELKEISATNAPIHLVCSQGLMDRYQVALQILRANGKLQCHNADNALIEGHCKLASHFL
jgi:2-dehydro-3-deoxygalactonokinase